MSSIGEFPAFISSTLDSLISNPKTERPWFADSTAKGKPTYPKPTTPKS